MNNSPIISNRSIQTPTMTNNNNRASSNMKVNASFNNDNNNEDIDTLQDIINQNNQNKTNNNSKANNQNDAKMLTIGKPISKRRVKDASLESNSDMHANKKFDGSESNNQRNEEDTSYTRDSMDEGGINEGLSHLNPVRSYTDCCFFFFFKFC